MNNKQRGVNCTPHYCKVGNVTRIEVDTPEYEDYKSLKEPIKE